MVTRVTEAIRKHSVRAAVAAVMGRNMSHNIGSHVLSYLSDEYLKSDASGKIIYSLGFYKYLQGRSDFIAEISTTRPTWATQMRLINDVIDPFVYSDHRTQKGELLNNIGRSVYGQIDSPLDASKIQIIIRLVSKNLEVVYKYNNQTYDRICVKDKNSIAFNNSEDPYIDIPHGFVGCHAFYSILENFLRNSFKHNNNKIITEILGNGHPFQAVIEIDDNVPFHSDLIRVRLSDNVSDYDKKIAGKIQKYIDGKESPLVNKDGSLKRGGGWGIKEMRISSAWLRNISSEDIQSVNKCPALLSIGNTDDRNTQEKPGMLEMSITFLTLRKELLFLNTQQRIWHLLMHSTGSLIVLQLESIYSVAR
jgi:hypothetical protein